MTADRVVFLYGSFARGDYDSWSDVDILIVGAPQYRPGELNQFGRWDDHPVHVSHYTWCEFEQMAASGSLFLHHLVAEAKPLEFRGAGERRITRLFDSLGRYELAPRDLIGFRSALRDAQEGLSLGLSTLFEMAVLGGVARHASVLACYLGEQPTFGRTSIRTACDLLGLPQLAESLEVAHRFRLFEEGQCPQPKPSDRAGVEALIRSLDKFLSALEALHDAKPG